MSTTAPIESTAVEKAGGATATFLDARLGSNRFLARNLGKVFPDHWSFMLGEIALYSFIVVLLTGVFLTLWFKPSMVEVIYDGSYVPLQGVKMSEAYASALDISFDVRGGVLMRQMHHWAAMIFIASMMVHLLRVYFTGAYRKPRELNWVIGCLLLLLGTLEGFTGYSLPDDLLSGTGIRAADGSWVVRDDVFVTYRPQQGPRKAGPLSIGYAVYEGRHHMGPELGIGRALGDRFEESVLLVKTAWGGKSLAKDFRPPSAGGETGPFYLQMLAEYREAIAGIATDHPQLAKHRVQLDGVIWFQGWNDACDAQATAEYATNLPHLIGDLRREFKDPMLPFVAGETGRASCRERVLFAV